MEVIQVGSFVFRNTGQTFLIYAERTPGLEAARDEMCETLGSVLAHQLRHQLRPDRPDPEKGLLQDE